MKRTSYRTPDELQIDQRSQSEARELGRDGGIASDEPRKMGILCFGVLYGILSMGAAQEDRRLVTTPERG